MSYLTPELTIAVVSFNTRDLLQACLTSVAAATTGPQPVIHVIDNASVDGSQEMVRREFPNVLLIQNEKNVGFARANLQSYELVRTPYWMLLNSDAELRPGAVDSLITCMRKKPDVALLTARVVNIDGSPQHCAQQVPSAWRTAVEGLRLHKLMPAGLRGRVLLGPYWSYDRDISVGWTWGTALLARMSAVRVTGPLDSSFFLYGEDLEWCLRVRKMGWRVAFCHEAEAVHHGGGSTAESLNEQGRNELKMLGERRALFLHRSQAQLLALDLSTLAALCVDYLVAFLARRDRSGIRSALQARLNAASRSQWPRASL